MSRTPDDPTPPVKRRRGRQPRPSLLTDTVKTAVRTFALAVGRPKVIEPAGFRDFRGWLASISAPNADLHWLPLVEAVAQDCSNHSQTIDDIKPDLVREIVKAIVIPREGESSKLVSTNCGRQCARPSSGVTLMTILDTVFADLQPWRDMRARLAAGNYLPPVTRRDASHSRIDRTAHSNVGGRAPPTSHSRYHSTLPPVNGLFPDNQHRSSSGSSHFLAGSSSHAAIPSRHDRNDHSRGSQASLPSFSELEDSLKPPVNLRKRGRG